MRPNTPFLVGEQGPELFVPKGFGDIVSNQDSRGALTAAPPVVVSAPPVNVSVVNVTDPSEVTSALDTAEGTQAILNIIRKNRRTVRSAVAT